MIPVELLSPAKNAEYGKAAILHGADAVYIGAPCYSARYAASNSIGEIEKLVRYAHLYRAKVYVALNTVLYDNEIADAVRLIGQLYETGVDALIIQDMGLLQFDLPPLPLFASTQTHNDTVDKVSFLEKSGFQRVILARELSLSEITYIRAHTFVALECFVHGALCVSYSGQCYMSHAITGRSGNRGVCAQPCRSRYNLLDADGKTLIPDAYMLSLRDMNLSAYLKELVKAGITSFKIEGRLKDLNYLKNITAYYRQLLDAILETDCGYVKASSGRTDFHFIPDPHKTFNRGYTDYFADGRRKKVASVYTQKSMGEKVGIVTQVRQGYFMIETSGTLSAGDGICWMQSGRDLEGVLVNRVDGSKVYPARQVFMKPGTEIYRNNDFQFEKQLNGHSAYRSIGVSLRLNEFPSGYRLQVCDEDGNEVESTIETEKIPAKDAVKTRTQTKTGLRKLGNTVFVAERVEIPNSFACFIPAAILNELRRSAMSGLENYRIGKYCFRQKNNFVKTSTHLYPDGIRDFRLNIANRHAKAFYERHGVSLQEPAFELQSGHQGKVLMTTKHCIKYQYDQCPHWQKPFHRWKEPLTLCDNNHEYRLEFDCKACVMKVKMA